MLTHPIFGVIKLVENADGRPGHVLFETRRDADDYAGHDDR